MKSRQFGMCRWFVFMMLCGVSIATIALTISAEEKEPQVVWLTDINEALEVSEKRPLVILFYAEWCPHCKKLKADVLESPEFQKYAGRAVFLKIEASNEEPLANAFREKLEVTGFPVLTVLVNKGNNQLERKGTITGGFPLKEYLSRVDALLDFADEDVEPLGVGDFSSPSAKCTPGDPACTQPADQDESWAAIAFNLLKKQEPTAEPALVREDEPSKDIAGISELLTEAGFEVAPADADQQWRDVTVSVDGWTFYIRVEPSANLEQVWITATLVSKVDIENTSASALRSLMRLNSSSGRGFLAINSNDNLTISVALDNDNLTARRLKSGIDDLVSISRTTSPEWLKLPTKAATAE